MALLRDQFMHNFYLMIRYPIILYRDAHEILSQISFQPLTVCSSLPRQGLAVYAKGLL